MSTVADGSTSQEKVDCIIIGGGPAGLTAATYLGRFLRNCVVIDAGAGRASSIPPGDPDPRRRARSGHPADARGPS